MTRWVARWLGGFDRWGVVHHQPQNYHGRSNAQVNAQLGARWDHQFDLVDSLSDLAARTNQLHSDSFRNEHILYTDTDTDMVADKGVPERVCIGRFQGDLNSLQA
ncbi:hypothetical protein IF2G_08633 [Cordyceps javanica]|nr:hypothetical protein IF2G_08633 [Cordyceps javanica]